MEVTRPILLAALLIGIGIGAFLARVLTTTFCGGCGK